MKRLLHILVVLFLALGLCGTSFAQQAPAPLTSLDFTIVGVGIGASPDCQAVPKGINSQVLTSLNVGDVDIAEIIKLLPQDYTVRADLSGPAFALPAHLVTKPGQPFDLPTLAILGKYTLANIRLCDGAGMTLLGAVPQAVAIDSIPDPIVTTHQLTLEELQQRENNLRGRSCTSCVSDLSEILVSQILDVYSKTGYGTVHAAAGTNKIRHLRSVA